MNLTNELTVFVTTIGSVEFPFCCKALERQDCQFTLDVIKDVSPMSAAFQAMIDRCKTPYYIQIDEDMHLYPDAVRKLYEAITTSPPNTVIFCYSLREVLRNIALIGVKIYRHDIIKKYPYNLTAFSCEMDQVDKMIKDGFLVNARWEKFDPSENPTVIGDLNISWDPTFWNENHQNIKTGLQDVYFKFKRDFQKLRVESISKKIAWMQEWQSRLLELYSQSKNPFHLFAFLGSVAGTTSMFTPNGEKSLEEQIQISEEFERLYLNLGIT